MSEDGVADDERTVQEYRVRQEDGAKRIERRQTEREKTEREQKRGA